LFFDFYFIIITKIKTLINKGFVRLDIVIKAEFGYDFAKIIIRVGER